jgi:hypothetical protein
VLLGDNIVAEGEAKTCAFAGRFRCEEWIEHLVLHFGRNTAAVVANPDLDAVAQVSGRGGKRRLVAITHLGLALHRGIEAVRNQIEKYACNFLRE